MNINISSRRDFLAQTALASMAALLPLTSVFAQTTTVSPKVDLAAQAFLWGLPLFLTGRYLKIAAERGADFNRFYLNPKLSTPDSHVAGPNIDTLYGFGWIDLTKGPQVVTVPEVIDRYYSLQLIDVYGHVFNYIGSRVTGSKAGAYAITPPGYTGVLPAGVTEIKAPSDIIEILVRTEVKG